jgi:hypothetical protein
MADDYTGIVLWDEEDGALGLEEELPLPDDLRARVKAWLARHEELMADTAEGWQARLHRHDHDGYALATDLQAALGPAYRIDYHFETDEVRREVGVLPPVRDTKIAGPRMPGKDSR